MINTLFILETFQVKSIQKEKIFISPFQIIIIIMSFTGLPSLRNSCKRPKYKWQINIHHTSHARGVYPTQNTSSERTAPTKHFKGKVLNKA